MSLDQGFTTQTVKNIIEGRVIKTNAVELCIALAKELQSCREHLQAMQDGSEVREQRVQDGSEAREQRMRDAMAFVRCEVSPTGQAHIDAALSDPIPRGETTP